MRRIAEHREKGSEQEIRTTYQSLLKDLRAFISVQYEKHSEDDKLTYAILQQKGEFANFIDQAERLVLQHTGPAADLTAKTVEEVYAICWQGMRDAVKCSTTNQQLHTALKGLHGATPEVVQNAVNNPISGLTLNSRLQKHRQSVIYGIKQQIGIGLTQGDTYTTMARRVAGEVGGDYKKAVRIVRTETHRVRESGFHDSAITTHNAVKQAGYGMTKTWRTMQDERVRPQCRIHSGKGWKTVIRGPYDHMKMEGVCIPVDQQFDLGGGVMTDAPGQSGVAGQDINCRCFLEYSLKKLQQSDTLSEVNTAYLPVTDEAIQNVSYVQSSVLSPEASLELQNSHRNLLHAVQDKPIGTEAAAVCSMDGKCIKMQMGTIGEVRVPTSNSPFIAIHNHPSGETFSLQDISFFAINDQMRVLTAVGNNGVVHLIEKAEDYDFAGLYHLLKDSIEKVPDFQAEPQKYVSFMERFLKEAEKYGYKYQEG